MTDSPQSPEDDLTPRAERTVASVMARIEAAPPIRSPESDRWVDLQYLAVPALAASLLIAAAAVVLLARRPEPLAAPRTLADAVGLPAPIVEWIDTGALSPWALVGNLRGAR